MKPVVIYGAGGFAAMLRFYLTEEGGREVTAFTVDRAYQSSDTLDGLPVLPFESLAERFPPDACDLLIAVGYKVMRARKTVFEKVKAAGYRPIGFISKSVTVYPGLELGENNILLPGCIVEPLAAIGDHNVFWSGAVIGHESRIGSHNFFGARSVLGGCCTVGELCFFGVGALAIDKLTIRDETHLLPGAVLLTDTEKYTKYLGNPARAFKTHEQEGIVIER